MQRHVWRRGERAGAAVFSAALLGAVLAPLAQYRRPLAERTDGFPLSWYPMFSARRPRRVGVTYAVGVAADGARTPIPSTVLGPAGLNQVRRQLNAVVRRGGAAGYAAGLAERVAGRRDLRHVVRVEIVRGRFDLDRCLVTGPVATRERVFAAAAVHR